MQLPNKLHSWEKHAEWPLAAVALAFLLAYAVDVLAQPHGAVKTAVAVITAVTWVVFVVDYLVRLALATDRPRWFVRHLVDLAIVALPLLRPLRLLRLVVLLSALQKAVGNAIRGRVVIYAISSAVLLIFVASLAVLEAERPGPGEIKNYGQAVWWSITTFTTVGYGDLVPETTQGKLVAVLLMAGGLALIGTLTGTIASWIVERVGEADSRNRVATAAHVEQLRADVRQLTDEVRRLQRPIEDRT
ncbi:voltage-gated potassium channel [Mycolicibacterium rutilum]|uniref:Voltage-gated potassium channel n=1 Tax=Mycolicibacterium rutilum TaxID=370526 RepID=A0A1H6JQ97_MYCRU|nr:potassium channel family protein [Mycolicibacterium rutilum]SEH64318.1 voltage-gated potassium channel [Mycolicibacterium rutilum]